MPVGTATQGAAVFQPPMFYARSAHSSYPSLGLGSRLANSPAGAACGSVDRSKVGKPRRGFRRRGGRRRWAVELRGFRLRTHLPPAPLPEIREPAARLPYHLSIALPLPAANGGKEIPSR